MDEVNLLSKYKGCLLGLAIGDALGAPVELMSMSDIALRYGQAGITDFDSWENFKAGSYTDDTQLSLATAIGCMKAYQNYHGRPLKDIVILMYRQYLYWFKSMVDPFHIRGPGETCLNSLSSGRVGTVEFPINQSKGSGGVMRVAPVGLAYPPGEAFVMGTIFTAITHGHPSGYLSAGFLSELIAWIIQGEDLENSIYRSMIQLEKYSGRDELVAKIYQAVRLSRESKSTEKSLRSLGLGWVGEEALAIALYCSLKHTTNWREAVLLAVNHSGDSDSTGSITGAIMGTLLGVEAIPKSWVTRVEDSRKIQNLAEDMYRLFQLGETVLIKEHFNE